MYDSNRPSKSISGLLNKAIKLFTTYKVDTTPYVTQAASAYTEVGRMAVSDWRFIMFPSDHGEVSQREEAGEFI